jgi:hypothetical protein
VAGVWNYQRDLIYFPLPILSVVVDNMEEFQIRSDVHTVHTEYEHDFHVLNEGLAYRNLILLELTLRVRLSNCG